jgi:hypothetical protein
VFRAKDGHAYHGGMSPLQRSTFVGLEVYIPAGTERVLPGIRRECIGGESLQRI